jgi:hypothetical protein
MPNYTNTLYMQRLGLQQRMADRMAQKADMERGLQESASDKMFQQTAQMLQMTIAAQQKELDRLRANTKEQAMAAGYTKKEKPKFDPRAEMEGETGYGSGQMMYNKAIEEFMTKKEAEAKFKQQVGEALLGKKNEIFESQVPSRVEIATAGAGMQMPLKEEQFEQKKVLDAATIRQNDEQLRQGWARLNQQRQELKDEPASIKKLKNILSTVENTLQTITTTSKGPAGFSKKKSQRIAALEAKKVGMLRTINNLPLNASEVQLSQAQAALDKLLEDLQKELTPQEPTQDTSTNPFDFAMPQ